MKNIATSIYTFYHSFSFVDLIVFELKKCKLYVLDDYLFQKSNVHYDLWKKINNK